MFEVVDPRDVYYLQAQVDDTRVRLRGKRELVDVRRLDEVARVLARQGFVRIHRGWAVNLERVRQFAGESADATGKCGCSLP